MKPINYAHIKIFYKKGTVSKFEWSFYAHYWLKYN